MRALLLILLLLPTAAHPTVVDRIIAQVDDELVLQSDANLEERLAPLDPSNSPFWDPSHKTASERLVDAALIRLAAGTIDLYQPTSKAVRERREAVRIKIGDRAAWKAFLQRSGVDEQTLDNVLRRRMIVERYLGRNNQFDPATPELWLAACEVLVEQLRARSRVRLIQEQGSP